MDEDDEVMRRVTADPKSAELGCGGVFTAVVTRGKRDLSSGCWTPVFVYRTW
jgi:hypothetical protein